MSSDTYDSLIEAIAEKIAQPLAFDKLISDRRGTTVLKLENRESKDYFALKFATLPSYAANVIKNEVEVLQELEAFANYLYCDGGEVEGFAYVLTCWLGGEKVQKLMEVARTLNQIPDVVERRLGWLELSLKLTKKLHDLHTLGYLHYDIQPEHFRIIDNEVYLFDFGLSYLKNKTNVLYKGGLVHFQAIEVCNYILQENKTIEYNIKSEVYALAATLFFLYTEQTVIAYDFKLSLKEKLHIIATGLPRSFEDVRGEAFPEFEAVLQACLNPDLDKRVSGLSEVITALEKAIISLT